MITLLSGLLIFLSVHSIRIVADDWRTRQIIRFGAAPWRGLYSLASLLGLFLIVWGYGLTRSLSMDLWQPGGWCRYVSAALNLPAFFLLMAAYVPGNRIKAYFGHPFLLGVVIWAFAHLLSNGRLGDVLLFGTFLVWAVFDYRSMCHRDRLAGTTYPIETPTRDAIAAALGFLMWLFFVLFAHKWLIGVAPLS